MIEKKVSVKIEESLKLRIARSKWGDDFSDKPYGGCVHSVYNNIAGQITLSSIVLPFKGEDKATAILVVWSELVCMSDQKSVSRKHVLTQRVRSVEYPITNGVVDVKAVMETIEEAMIQVERNRLILEGFGYE